MIKPRTVRETGSLQAYAEETCKRFFGKYRGTVYNDMDPLDQGRVQVLVPAIQPGPLVQWAKLVTPIGGLQHGFFAVPPIGTGVFIEFEQGQIDQPLCTGCFWGSTAEVPKLAREAKTPGLRSIGMQTPTQNGITISDVPAGDKGGIQIKTVFGAKISITVGQIKIDNGAGASIELIGPTINISGTPVTINKGALSVL